MLVHGWTCTSKFWQKNAPELAKEFRVVTLDLRGHGNSSKTLTGYTIAQYGRDVRAVVERITFVVLPWLAGRWAAPWRSFTVNLLTGFRVMNPKTIPPRIHVLAKPTGSVCNLNCSYCFYLKRNSSASAVAFA